MTEVTQSSSVSIAETTWTADTRPPSSESKVPTSDQSKPIFFQTANPYAPTSVVLLHILFSSSLEWQHIMPKLSEYHLLIPDLPHHSRSRHIKPFSFDLAIQHVATMIRENAHNGRAHIVGVSTGAFIAQELVRIHPELVLSVFASGASPLRSFWRSVADRPKIVYLGLLGVMHSPSSVLFKMSGWCGEVTSSDLLKEIKRNTSARLSENGTRDTAAFTKEKVAEIATKGIRIVVIASKQDDRDGIAATAKMYKALNSGEGLESRGFFVKEAIHAWNLQLPDLFAKGIQAWIEKWPMPPEFEPLD
ncbi:Alpha/Beta hydrolase protein [Xylariales sp. PMI_506]|nr:Alpha/Beta hydrolase protein [Xylariales sp. PMI_506]